jgi:hypothetical protein
VIAVRTAPLVVRLDHAPASVLPKFDPEVAARAADLGLVVPDRLGAA